MTKITGKFDKFLCLDCETSGMGFGTGDPSKGSKDGEVYQSVSWGLVVADSETIKPIDKLYLEIKWDGHSTWNNKAEQIHKLSKEHLEQNGMSSEDAACEIASFVLDHFNPKKAINLAGHNIGSFDIFFLRSLLEPFGLMFKTSARLIDTNSIAFAAFNSYTSDQAFELLNVKRDSHNALEDAMASLKVIHATRTLMKTIIG
jgi:hypothetical protein